MKEAEAIFNHWNTMPEHKNWRTHRVFTPGMAKAVSQWLKEGYTPSYLCEAIDNYYRARTTKGCWWHDVCQTRWGFEIFFKGGSKKEEYNWKKFETEQFDMFASMTDAAKRDYIAQKRKEKKLQQEYEDRRLWLFENKDRWDELEKNPVYKPLVEMARNET